MSREGLVSLATVYVLVVQLYWTCNCGVDLTSYDNLGRYKQKQRLCVGAVVCCDLCAGIFVDVSPSPG